MSLQFLVERARRAYQPFVRPSATTVELNTLLRVCGDLPELVTRLYLDHNGCEKAADGRQCLIRMMPIEEAIEATKTLGRILRQEPDALGPMAWLWTDDNSNYIGVFTSGPLKHFVVRLDHEDPALPPIFRSAESWLARLLNELPDRLDVCDGVPELPATFDDPRWSESDRDLSREMLRLAKNELDDLLRRRYYICSLALLPCADTAKAIELFGVDDMWVPAAAVRLLELRGYKGGVSELERLARDGYPNGCGAAMLRLIRMGTRESRDAVARLEKTLEGQKLNLLNQWQLLGRSAINHWP